MTRADKTRLVLRDLLRALKLDRELQVKTGCNDPLPWSIKER
jgi:hypothetical protein